MVTNLCLSYWSNWQSLQNEKGLACETTAHHGYRHRLVTMETGTAVVCNYRSVISLYADTEYNWCCGTERVWLARLGEQSTNKACRSGQDRECSQANINLTHHVPVWTRPRHTVPWVLEPPLSCSFHTNSKLWLTIPWYLKHHTHHTMELLDHHNPQTVHSELTCGKHGHFQTQFSQLFWENTWDSDSVCGLFVGSSQSGCATWLFKDNQQMQEQIIAKTAGWIYLPVHDKPEKRCVTDIRAGIWIDNWIYLLPTRLTADCKAPKFMVVYSNLSSVVKFSTAC